MKNFSLSTLLLVCFGAILLTAPPTRLEGLEFQSFTDQGGRTLKAHVWKVVGEEAFLQLTNGRLIKVNLSIFSAASQAELRKHGLPPATKPFVANPFNPISLETNAPTPAIADGLPATKISKPITTPPPPVANGFPTTAIANPIAGIAGTNRPIGAPRPAFTQTPPTPPTAASNLEVKVSDVLREGAALQAYVDLQSLSQSALYKTFQTMAGGQSINPLSPEEGTSPIKPEDIKSIAASMQSLDDLDLDNWSSFLNFGDKESTPPDGTAPSSPGLLPANSIIAIFLNKPMAPEVIIKSIQEGGDEPPPVVTQESGATLLRPGQGQSSAPANLAVALKNQSAGTVILAGNVDTVKSTLGGNRSQSSLKIPAILGPNGAGSNFWLSLEVPRSIAQDLAKGASESKDNPMMAQLGGLLTQIKAVGLAAKVTDTGRLNLILQCNDDTVANQVAGALNGLLTLVKLGMQNDPAAAKKMPSFLQNLVAQTESSNVSIALEMKSSDLMPILQGLGGREDSEPAVDVAAPSGFPSSTPTAGAPSFGAPTNTNPFAASSKPKATPAEASSGNPFPTSTPIPNPTNPFPGAPAPKPPPTDVPNPFAPASGGQTSTPAKNPKNPFGE